MGIRQITDSDLHPAVCALRLKSNGRLLTSVTVFSSCGPQQEHFHSGHHFEVSQVHAVSDWSAGLSTDFYLWKHVGERESSFTSPRTLNPHSPVRISHLPSFLTSFFTLAHLFVSITQLCFYCFLPNLFRIHLLYFVHVPYFDIFDRAVWLFGRTLQILWPVAMVRPTRY